MTLVLVAAVDGPRGGVAAAGRRAGPRRSRTAALGLLAAVHGGARRARRERDADRRAAARPDRGPRARRRRAGRRRRRAARVRRRAAIRPPRSPSPPRGCSPASASSASRSRSCSRAPGRSGSGRGCAATAAAPEEVAVAFVGSAAAPRYATAHPTLRAVAEDARLAERRGRAAARGGGARRSRSPAARREAARSSSRSRRGLDAALARGAGSAGLVGALREVRRSSRAPSGWPASRGDAALSASWPMRIRLTGTSRTLPDSVRGTSSIAWTSLGTWRGEQSSRMRLRDLLRQVVVELGALAQHDEQRHPAVVPSRGTSTTSASVISSSDSTAR